MQEAAREQHASLPLNVPIEQGDGITKARAQQRLFHLRSCVQTGNNDEALNDLILLCEYTHGHDDSTPGVAAIWQALLQGIKQVAPIHAPTRTYFSNVTDKLEILVLADERCAMARQWREWAELSCALGQESRLIQVYEQRRADDGSIDTDAMNYYALEKTFDVLVDSNRYIDAGKFYADIVGEASDSLRLTDLIVKDEPDWYTEKDIEVSRREDQQHVALLYALALAAGRETDANEIARAFLARYDSVEPRLQLVTSCIRVGVVSPSVWQWVAYLDAQGLDVAELKSELSDIQQK